MATLETVGLSFELRSTPKGPLVSTEDPLTAPLAWVVNHAVTGDEERTKNFQRCLQERKEIIVQGLWATPPYPDNDLTQVKEHWKKLTGSYPGEDSYLVGVTFIGEDILIPRSALQQIIADLLALREEYQASPHAEEDFYATIESTPSEPIHSSEPEPDITEEPLPLKLFATESTASTPSDSEQENLQYIEDKAALLETLEAEALAQEQPTSLALATIAVKRRTLQVELELAGLLSAAQVEAKQHWLKQWELSRLIAYYDATVQLLDYYQSPQRQKCFGYTPPPSIESGRISLDWFRVPVPIPGNMHPYDWLAYCEEVLRKNHASEGDQAQSFVHLGNQWFILCWRKDDGKTSKLFCVQHFEK